MLVQTYHIKCSALLPFYLLCWKPYQWFRLTCNILSSPLFHLIYLVSISNGILLSQSIFNFCSSWIINFGSSKLGVNMPKGSKTNEINDKIPRLVLGYSLVTGSNVRVSWLIFQIIQGLFPQWVCLNLGWWYLLIFH